MRSDRGLPADRRVTPEALDAYDAPRPGTGFSVGDLAWGATVAWLTLPLHLTVIAWAMGDADLTGIAPWGLAALLVLAFASFPVVLLGVPAGVLVALWMRRVANQWWHVGAFAVAGAVVGLLGTSLLLGGPGLALGLPAALAAATGRAAIWPRFRPAGRGG